MAKRSKSLVSRFRLGLIVVGSLFVAAPAVASELNVADKVGTPFLRVDAAEGTTFDLVISFKNTSLNLPTDSSLTLVSDSGSKKNIPLNANTVRDGARIQNVALGDYTVTANPDLLEIKSISVTENNTTASNESESGDISTTTYAVGAAALAGGVIAVSAGGDGMDVFSSGSSSSNSARAGSGTSGNTGASAVAGSAGAPQISALTPVSQFDPNRPNVSQYVGAPSAFPTPRGAPPTEDTGSGPRVNPGGATPTPTPVIPNPTVAPAPQENPPMTAS